MTFDTMTILDYSCTIVPLMLIYINVPESLFIVQVQFLVRFCTVFG